MENNRIYTPTSLHPKIGRRWCTAPTPQPRTRGLASTSTIRSSPSIMISNHRTHKSISHLLTTVLYISRARYSTAPSLLLGCNLLRLIQLPSRLLFLSIGLSILTKKGGQMRGVTGLVCRGNLFFIRYGLPKTSFEFILLFFSCFWGKYEFILNVFIYSFGPTIIPPIVPSCLTAFAPYLQSRAKRSAVFCSDFCCLVQGYQILLTKKGHPQFKSQDASNTFTLPQQRKKGKEGQPGQ